MERTEEDKLTQAPLIVKFSGKEYPIRPLVIRESREWRRKLTAVFRKLPEYINVKSDNPEAFGNALNALFIEMPDAIADLFFDYARDLKRDEIENIATDMELAKAFEGVMGFAFPLSQSLVKVLGRAQA